MQLRWRRAPEHTSASHFTMKKEDCSKILINISLITLYIIFFGRMFFQKYISGGVVINNLEEKTHNISPPTRNR